MVSKVEPDLFRTIDSSGILLYGGTISDDLVCFWDGPTMREQPQVCNWTSQTAVSRGAALTMAVHRLFDSLKIREFPWVLRLGLSLGWFCLPAAANAQDAVITINNEFINASRPTTGLLVSGPPEVARDMAIIDSAMFDAANAASGLAYAPVAYNGGAVSGVSVGAAALSAGYTAMQAIFANSIWSGAGGSAPAH